MKHISINFQFPEFSDVTLIVGKSRFIAHRFVLGIQSHFWEILLFGTNYRESNADEVTITAPEDAFKLLLEFMYKGTLDLREIEVKIVIELLELCHRYEISEVEEDIKNYLCFVIDAPNAVKGLEIAKLLGIPKLEKLCWTLIEMIVEGIYNVELNLSYQVLAELVLSRQRLVSDVNLHKLIVKLTKYDEEYCSEEEKSELLAAVKPEEIQHVVEAYDVFLPSLESTAEVIKGPEGFCYKRDLRVVWPNEFGDPTKNDKPGRILVFKLDKVYAFNYIYFRSKMMEERIYSVKISMDGKSWHDIYTKFPKIFSESFQRFYFPLTKAKFIKLESIYYDIMHCCYFFDISYEQHDFKFLSIYPVPTENVVSAHTIHASHTVNANLLKILGKFSEDGRKTPYVSAALGSNLHYDNEIEFNFNQPFILSSCSLRLWDYDGRKYSFIVKVSSKFRESEVICDKSDELCDGWQTIHFAPRIVEKFIIKGIRATHGKKLYLAHFQAPAQPVNTVSKINE